MDHRKSLEEINKALIQLKEENQTIPILVEGDKDIKALRSLGIQGEVLSINSGKSLPNFCDIVARCYRKIIILTDWDKKGGYLCRMLKKNLRGRIDFDIKYRELFAKHAMIRKVEGLPSWLKTMEEKLYPVSTLFSTEKI
jgi:5S rRNA maturation endonuclease (ribonuclease M5)